MSSFWRNISFGAAGLVYAWPVLLAAAEPDIGVFTAVEGKVSVQHAQSPQAVSAKLSDTVLFRDLIETQKESRTKALLNDDSILTVGEHSRVEITEHIYDPGRSLRSVVVNLVQGKVRALVGKVFEGSGSKFEIHTPTAVAAARGTYFVVWHVDGASGIANVGSHGNVDFRSGGHTVSVVPGTFSFSPPGGGPPVAPSPMTGSNVPAQVTAAVQATDLPSAPDSESPSRAAAASGGTAPIQSPSTMANVSGSTSVTSSGTTSQSGTTSSTLTTGTTPPAVTSGAASGSTGAGGGSGSGETGSGSGGDTGSGSGGSGGGGGGTGGSGGGGLPQNRGLHLGQFGLQPGFGNPTPGNLMVPPAVTSGAAAGRGPSFTPPGHGGTPPGHGGTPPGHGGTPPGHGGTPPGHDGGPPPGKTK